MRPEKNLIISEIKSRIDKTPYVLIADYTGMQVPEFNELRNRLSGAKAEFRVVKNTLLRRALKDSNLPDLESYLHGQSAVVLGNADVSAAAKVLKAFTKEFQKPVLKIGILDRAVVNVDQIMALAELPSKDVLQAKLLGLLLAPASTLVRLINTPASQVAQVIKAPGARFDARVFARELEGGLETAVNNAAEERAVGHELGGRGLRNGPAFDASLRGLAERSEHPDERPHYFSS